MSLILTINPGTTSTRIGLFETGGTNEVTPVLEQTIEHDEAVMAGFATMPTSSTSAPTRSCASSARCRAASGSPRSPAAAAC